MIQIIHSLKHLQVNGLPGASGYHCVLILTVSFFQQKDKQTDSTVIDFFWPGKKNGRKTGTPLLCDSFMACSLQGVLSILSPPQILFFQCSFLR